MWAVGFDGDIKGFAGEVSMAEHREDEMDRSFGMVGLRWRVKLGVYGG